MAAEPYSISRYTALVVVHAVNIHVWHLNQISQTLRQGMKVIGFASNALISHSLTTLARCRDVLRHQRLESAEPSWDDMEGPLLFNSEAMLRVIYTRLFTDVATPQKFTLLCSPQKDKTAALKLFVNAKQDRNPWVTRAATIAFDSFSIPVQMGFLLVRKTAAFTWGVETAVSAWGCGKYHFLAFSTRGPVPNADMVLATAILLCKWIHCIETLVSRPGDGLAEAEVRLIERIKSVLGDMDIDLSEDQSLAAALARAWAALLNDVSRASPSFHLWYLLLYSF